MQSSGAGPVLDESGRPLDQISLVGISATGYHGVFAHERGEGQTFRADVVVHLDTRRAAATDDLTRTVDYGALATQVAAVLAGDPVNLIETVAERIAATALAHPGVAAVDVRVHKPQAPVTVPFEDIVVTIRRDHVKLPAAEPWVDPAGSDESSRHPAGAGEDVDGAARALEAIAAAVSASVPAARPPAPTRSDGAAEQREKDRLEQAPAAPVKVVLALGSNLGPSQDTLRDAVAALRALDGLEVLAVSPLARTAPVGGADQPDFLNAVVIAETTFSASGLLRAVQRIEDSRGRERLERWGPRTLDIDLIVYGSILAVTDDLELPHPRAHQRAFVLQPWAQIAPDAVLPGLGGGPVAALAATAPDRGGIRWLALDWLSAPPQHHGAPDEQPGGQPGEQPGGQPGEPGPAPVASSGAHALPAHSWLPDPPPEPAPADLRS